MPHGRAATCMLNLTFPSIFEEWLCLRELDESLSGDSVLLIMMPDAYSLSAPVHV